MRYRIERLWAEGVFGKSPVAVRYAGLILGSGAVMDSGLPIPYPDNLRRELDGGNRLHARTSRLIGSA